MNLKTIEQLINHLKTDTLEILGDYPGLANSVHALYAITSNTLCFDVQKGDLLLVDLERTPFLSDKDTLCTLLSTIKNCSGIIIISPKALACKSLLSEWLHAKKYNIIYCENKSNRNLVKQLHTLFYQLQNKHALLETLSQTLLLGDTTSYDFKDCIFLCKLLNYDVFSHFNVIMIENTCDTSFIQALHTTFDITLSINWNTLMILICDEQHYSLQKLKNLYCNHPTPLDCKISIGGTYYALDNVHKSFKEALRTYDMIDTLCKETKILEYRELGLYRVLYEFSGSEGFEQYSTDIFKELLLYDQNNNTTLFKTLECYFQNECDFKRTSAQLYVHVNTMRYRLNQIESILDCDLKNVNTITEIVTAFKVRRLISILNEK